MKKQSKSNKDMNKKIKNRTLLSDAADDMAYSEDDTTLTPPEGDKKRKYIFGLLAIVVIVGLAYFKFNYLLVPAKVGMEPIYIWQYFSYLHRNYGKEGMQRLTTQSLINQAIVKSGVTVKQEDIQKEVDLLDQQASASGGIQAMLTAQQMTLEDLKDQLRIQMAVKEILKDKIAVTDAEVDDSYKKNRELFRGVPEAEAKIKVREQLENQKFQTEASNWLAEIRNNTQVQILFPELQ